MSGNARHRHAVAVRRPSPRSAEAWLAQAEEHLAGYRVDEALSALEQAISVDPLIRTAMSEQLRRVHRYLQSSLPVLNLRTEDLVPPRRRPSVGGRGGADEREPRREPLSLHTGPTDLFDNTPTRELGQIAQIEAMKPPKRLASPNLIRRDRLDAGDVHEPLPKPRERSRRESGQDLRERSRRESGQDLRERSRRESGQDLRERSRRESRDPSARPARFEQTLSLGLNRQLLGLAHGLDAAPGMDAPLHLPPDAAPSRAESAAPLHLPPSLPGVDAAPLHLPPSLPGVDAAPMHLPPQRLAPGAPERPSRRAMSAHDRSAPHTRSKRPSAPMPAESVPRHPSAAALQPAVPVRGQRRSSQRPVAGLAARPQLAAVPPVHEHVEPTMLPPTAPDPRPGVGPVVIAARAAPATPAAPAAASPAPVPAAAPQLIRRSAPIVAQPQVNPMAYEQTALIQPGQSPDAEVVCERCWKVFKAVEQACPDAQCRAPRPDGGWAPMPYLFRNRYQFVKQIGRGSMGAVFEACEDGGGRRAIKVMKQRNATEAPRLREMFEQEIRAAGLLGQQDCFVRVSAFDANGDLPFLEMELVEWPTMREMLRRTKLPADDVARLGVAILEGLGVMHEHNMVHRDLKPANVFVEERREGFAIKIADLGGWSYDSRAQTKGIGIREIVGTLPYLAPEQTRIGPLTTASDIFAVAALLWEAATGHVPYPTRGRTLADQLDHRFDVCRKVPPRPENMPKALYRVLSRAMSHDPDKRPTAGQMVEDLRALVSRGELAVEGPTRSARAVHRPRGGPTLQRGAPVALAPRLSAAPPLAPGARARGRAGGRVRRRRGRDRGGHRRAGARAGQAAPAASVTARAARLSRQTGAVADVRASDSCDRAPPDTPAGE